MLKRLRACVTCASCLNIFGQGSNFFSLGLASNRPNPCWYGDDGIWAWGPVKINALRLVRSEGKSLQEGKFPKPKDVAPQPQTHSVSQILADNFENVMVYFSWAPGPNLVVTISTRVGFGSRLALAIGYIALMHWRWQQLSRPGKGGIFLKSRRKCFKSLCQWENVKKGPGLPILLKHPFQATHCTANFDHGQIFSKKKKKHNGKVKELTCFSWGL